jgi:transposase
MKESMALSMDEISRLKILEQVDQGRLSLKSGTDALKISYRHGKRLLVRYRREGPGGLVHRRRGGPAHNAFNPEVRERVIKLHQEHYSQFNDTHFVEMLREREGLGISRETVRRWLREAGIEPKRRRRPPRHRSRRPRRSQMGLMMQWDGSPHKWFGPQGPTCSLMHAVDDATGDALGMVFRPTEDTIGYLKLLDMVIRLYGIPASVYQDRHSALHRNDNHWSHEEELAGRRFPTHVGRVLEDLGIKTLTAYSAQAKGRIERQGGTFQDRLIAEMALEGITEIDTANQWVETRFLPRFNRRFAKKAEKPGCVFRKISAKARYNLISFAYEATVANDNTVRLGGLTIDIPPGPKKRSYAKRRVLVRQHLDGAWTVWLEKTCIAKHPPTPLKEPLRIRKPHQKGDDHRARHILQVYLETTPAHSKRGHFCFAERGTF